MSDIFSELQWRGLVHQCTDPEFIPQWLREGARTVYIGFDPTADSLHVGSMLQLMTLRRFQQAGHRVIALLGGATGMIGDPSGKSAERRLLDDEALRENVAGIRLQMQNFLDFDGPNPAILVDNLQWMREFTYIDFLRRVGKNFPVNVMMAKDSVKSRLGREDTGISYTEFSYMLLQAYDFVHLYQQYGCELQVGGSDQWGNITAGIDLGRRMLGKQLHGFTGPLLVTSDGAKMGKTEAGAIWLSAARTSPYHFYQYWINVDDADVSNCLRLLTELNRDQIEALDASRASNPGDRASQKKLASELTRLVHGEEGLDIASRATRIFFGDAIEHATDAMLADVFGDVPSCEIDRSQLAAGYPLVDALVASGLCGSKGEARRTVKEGGAYVNNSRVGEPDAALTTESLASETAIVLRRGKKKYALVRVN